MHIADNYKTFCHRANDHLQDMDQNIVARICDFLQQVKDLIKQQTPTIYVVVN